MINGHLIEQIAHRVSDVNKAVSRYAAQGVSTWIRDEVDAVHIFTDKDYRLGESFKVKLAFNYDLLDGGAKMEFELIELVNGLTVQLDPEKGSEQFYEHRANPQYQILSHWGYHVANQGAHDAPDSLSQELSAYIQKGYRVAQVSQTVLHANTQRRYRYAFVDTRQLHGCWLKIIQRMSMPSDERTLNIGRDQFRWLENQRAR